jgi:hypothetical protein
MGQILHLAARGQHCGDGNNYDRGRRTSREVEELVQQAQEQP